MIKYLEYDNSSDVEGYILAKDICSDFIAYCIENPSKSMDKSLQELMNSYSINQIKFDAIREERHTLIPHLCKALVNNEYHILFNVFAKNINDMIENKETKYEDILTLRQFDEKRIDAIIKENNLLRKIYYRMIGYDFSFIEYKDFVKELINKNRPKNKDFFLENVFRELSLNMLLNNTMEA